VHELFIPAAIALNPHPIEEAGKPAGLCDICGKLGYLVEATLPSIAAGG
jgi:hypothetical protein